MGFGAFLRRSLARWSGQEPAASGPAPETASADAGIWYRKGADDLAAGRLAEAEAALSRAVEMRHDYVDALVLQALVQKKQGRLEDATDGLLLAEHFKPDVPEVQFQLGLIAAAQGRDSEAEARFRSVVATEPARATAWNALGTVLFKRGVLEEAGECFRRAIAIDPGYGQAHSNLGCLLFMHLDESEAGAAHIETAWRLEPKNEAVRCNWAGLLEKRGDLSGALALWSQIVERNGEDAEKARLNRALLLLKRGEFAQGWSDYEARKRTESEYRPRQFSVPEWNDEPLAGRTILVHAEQGLGDQIMFASCIPDLMLLAGHCVVECTLSLEPIFRRSFPAATIVTPNMISPGAAPLATAPAIDYRVAVGSLPLRFRRSLAEFPAHDGYLRADREKTAAWKRRLADLPGRLKIGISWRGGMKRTRQALRSIPLVEWLPILRHEDACFVSLQYTDCAAELAALERDHAMRVHHWQEAIDSYDETAALVSALDRVISVQTSIVHLSGALGAPAWVLVPAEGEWRYLRSGERMPWYPSVRLWRQDTPGEWRAVIERVAGALDALAHEG